MEWLSEFLAYQSLTVHLIFLIIYLDNILNILHFISRIIHYYKTIVCMLVSLIKLTQNILIAFWVLRLFYF